MDDRLSANIVEITVDYSGKVWVNIDGKCAARVGHAKLVVIDANACGKMVAHKDPQTLEQDNELRKM